MTLGALLAVLNDVETVIIRYQNKNIFTGKVMDISQNLPLKYWFYDVTLVMALDNQLFIEIIESWEEAE
ncbi:hypothetical protein CUS95_08085 [Enterococcus faecium]|jgi:hypothetical protein|uniref:hypothetical protein n=1 Tax=Enterococcus TaxID=1350 RepID=UPI00033023FC|nr:MULTISPECIES: hypothetical protein [Enterococcus]EMF0361944.1 hypothetical protein [Enterococcus faecium]EOG38589.1 hypothetical protein SMS_01173 [Enterococcus faecium EnGen0184]MDQ8399183.1 hypothetical protein [Enterococcus faecium]NTJ95884.1 hypothetical protein [Enterococcus faecium]NTR54861.1 hypothetical protein [Enterococcus faecium]